MTTTTKMTKTKKKTMMMMMMMMMMMRRRRRRRRIQVDLLMLGVVGQPSMALEDELDQREQALL